MTSTTVAVLRRRYFAIAPSWSETKAHTIDVIGGTETDTAGMDTAVAYARKVLGKSVIVKLVPVSDTKPNRVLRLPSPKAECQLKAPVREARAGLTPESDWDRKEAQAVKDDKTKAVTVQLDASQLATVLSALRSFQERYQNKDAGTIADDWPDHFAGVMPLCSEDISDLCEEINCSPKPADSAETLNQIQDIIVNRYGEEEEPFTKRELTAILDAIVSVLEAKPETPKPADPVIVVKGGVVHDVCLPIPNGNSPATSIAYSLIDYDDMDCMNDEQLARLWASFSPALRAYYKKHCCDEFDRYFKPALDAQPRIIPTTFGNQKKRPKCYRCGRVIRDAEYMREGPIGEGKARHINACPSPKK